MLTIQNTAGVDAVIAPADSNNPGVMPAADKVNLDALPNEWVTGTAYSKGDQVSHDNIIYSVIEDHTSVGNGIPNEVNYAPLGTVPAATRSTIGLLTATDKRKVDTIPTEWNSTTAYGGASQVSLNDIIYVSLTGSTNQQPETQGVLYTLEADAVVAADDVNIVVVVDGVSTTLATFTTVAETLTIPATTVEGLVDGLIADFNSSEYTIAENSAGTGVIVTKNDHAPFTLLSDALNTGFSFGSFNATAEFWQEELEYITSRGVNVLADDPEDPFDGQVWYNSTEDLVKYFSAIDTTDQTECEANGGTFTSGACSINGVINVVSHTAREFLSTEEIVPRVPSYVSLTVGGVGTTSLTQTTNLRFSSDKFVEDVGTDVEIRNQLSFRSLTGSSGNTGFIDVNSTSDLFKYVYYEVANNGTTESLTSTLISQITHGVSNVGSNGSTGDVTWRINAIASSTNANTIEIRDLGDNGTTPGDLSISSFSSDASMDWTFVNEPEIAATTKDNALDGQTFITGSIVFFQSRAYIYLGSGYTTSSTNNTSPEINAEWVDITASGGGSLTGGVTVLVSDPLSPSDGQVWFNTSDNALRYHNKTEDQNHTVADAADIYNKTESDNIFATNTDLTDYSKFSDLGIRDVPGVDSVLYHSGLQFQNPADLDETLIVNTPIDSTTELMHINMYVIRTNIAEINTTTFTVTWGGVSETFNLESGVYSDVLTFSGLTPGTTSSVTIRKSDGGTLAANLKVVLDHAGTVVSTPATNIFLNDTIDAKLGDYDTEAVASGKYATTLQGDTADTALQPSDLDDYDTAVVASGKYLEPDDVRPDVNISVHHAQVDSRVSGEEVFLSADLENFHSQITQISTHITQNTAALDDYVQFKYYALRDDVKHNSLAWRFVQNPSGYVGAWDTTTSYAGISTVVSHDD